MNSFLNEPKQRLKDWKELRNKLTDLSPENLKKVSMFWSYAPISNRTLDPYDPKLWPTAWELMYSNDYCRSAIGLGMYLTFFYTDIASFKELGKLILVLDQEVSELYLAPLIDDNYILNYNLGTIEEFKKVRSKIIVQEIFIRKDDRFISLKVNKQ